MEAPLPPPRANGPFVPDFHPARDDRFHGLYNFEFPPHAVYNAPGVLAEERNLALLCKRTLEMDVPEMMSSFLYERRDQPWEFYLDYSRQLWDEARHSMMGTVALEARGVDWTKIPLNIGFSLRLNLHATAQDRQILLYAIEQSLMPRDRGKPYEHRVAAASGDRLSALFHDYDWADEVLHVDIARRCLKPELPGGLAEARQRADELWAKVADALQRDPLPTDGSEGALADWWPRFVRAVLGRDAAPAPGTHVKDWRPLSG